MSDPSDPGPRRAGSQPGRPGSALNPGIGSSGDAGNGGDARAVGKGDRSGDPGSGSNASGARGGRSRRSGKAPKRSRPPAAAGGQPGAAGPAKGRRSDVAIGTPLVPPTRAGAGRCKLVLALRTPDVKPPLRGWLAGAVERVAEAAGLARVRLSVAVVGDEEMGRLHERYLGDPETTDVLTFDLSPGTGRGAGGDGAGIDPGGGWRGGRVEGEVVVCMDEARRQASRRGHAVREECLLYVVHGLLHLMGYEDDTRTAFRKMHRRENELLTAAGYGALFGRVS